MTRRLAKQRVRTVKNVGQTPYGRPQGTPPAKPEPELSEDELPEIPLDWSENQKIFVQFLICTVFMLSAVGTLAGFAVAAVVGGGIGAMGLWWWVGAILETLWLYSCVKGEGDYFRRVWALLR